MQCAVRLLNVLQIGNAVDINQHRGGRETEPQQGNQALTPRQNFGVVAMSFQQGDSFWNAARHLIIEGTWYHNVTSNKQPYVRNFLRFKGNTRQTDREEGASRGAVP